MVPQLPKFGTHKRAQIMLQYWVYHDDVENIFLVEISKNKTIRSLTKVIKDASPKLRDVAEDSIQLYSVLIPRDDERLKDKLKHLSLKNELSLNSRTQVSTHFSDSDEGEERRLVVVNGPSSGSSATELPVAIVPEMTLNYWVRTDPLNSILSVEISSTETVKALRQLVKNKRSNRFHGLDVDELVLYKVLLTFIEDGSPEDALGIRTTRSLDKPLKDFQKLSTIFEQPSADTQHYFIIDTGLLIVQCWIRGADHENFFRVQIPVKAAIYDLKCVIQPKLDEILSLNNLNLYEISTNDAIMFDEYLNTLGSGRYLKGVELVEDVFNDVPFFQIPYVVIDLGNIAPSPTPGPSATHPRMQYFEVSTHNLPTRPSQLGEPKFFKLFQETDRRVEWTRPPGSTRTVTPVTLLHPIFGQFVDDCDTYVPTSKENAFALDLSSIMPNFFTNEDERRDVFHDILRKHGIGIVPSVFARYISDGDAHVNGRRYLIMEAKSDVGSKGAEPYCQAILYYMAANKDLVKEAFTSNIYFNFPCLIITLFGPHICFSGAVWANRPNYQVLSTALPLFWHPSHTTMQQSAARHLGAFLKACHSLRQLYKKFNQSPTDFQGLQPEFPYPQCYTSLDGKSQVHFKYTQALEASKLLFVVNTEAGKQLCVKFARAYTGEVHQWCAALGISPSLKGLNAIPGGWHMVVMDFLKDYECLQHVKQSLSGELKAKLKEELRMRLAELHGKNFVHGDVRDANMMVRMEKDQLHWMLVDFDWSGKTGEARYPMNLNRGPNLRRPEGAHDGELILASHDMEMLDYLFD